jgi:hypothetical protein
LARSATAKLVSCSSSCRSLRMLQHGVGVGRPFVRAALQRTRCRRASPDRTVGAARSVRVNDRRSRPPP